MLSAGVMLSQVAPPVAVVHGAEHLLEDALCLLFIYLCPCLQQYAGLHDTEVIHLLMSSQVPLCV